MIAIPFDSSRPRFPDPNENRKVIDWDALVTELGDTRILGFKVGNGWLNDPMSDSSFEDHFQGAESHGLVALGYWFGAHKVERYLSAFPPKEGRIPCLDFEFPRDPPHVITSQDVDDATAFVVKIHDEWGRWPWFYGHATWITAGQPEGTEIENCPYWGPDYLGELTVPTGVGTPVVHQYAASSKGPRPHFFPGVANGVDPDTGETLGPDMNCLLVPFEIIRQTAGLGGEDVALDPEKDQDTFNKMLATALHVGTSGDPPFWQRMLLGIGDVVREHEKRVGIDDPYEKAFDWAASLKKEDPGRREPPPL
jgi:hypothetical protein